MTVTAVTAVTAVVAFVVGVLVLLVVALSTRAAATGREPGDHGETLPLVADRGARYGDATRAAWTAQRHRPDAGPVVPSVPGSATSRYQVADTMGTPVTTPRAA